MTVSSGEREASVKRPVAPELGKACHAFIAKLAVNTFIIAAEI